MKKKITIIISIIIVLFIAGIIALAVYRSSEGYRQKNAANEAQVVVGSSSTGCEAVNPDDKDKFKDYTQNSDGTWECEGNTYKYKLEITGRMNNATCDTTFVYLSNIKEITFDQAWKASGLSSDMNDYFDIEDAVLVMWQNVY
ncbi:hypothetical protein [Gemmiger formicilis]